MTSDGSIPWAIAATIALFSLDLSAAQAGPTGWADADCVRGVFVPGPRQMKCYRLSRRQARQGADSRLSTVE